jgi:hypothetical protein
MYNCWEVPETSLVVQKQQLPVEQNQMIFLFKKEAASAFGRMPD